MNHAINNGNFVINAGLAAVLLCAATFACADKHIPIVDDFCDAAYNQFGLARQFVNDTMVGGKTHTEYAVKNCELHAKGKIVPPRGQPGWASTVLPLAAVGGNYDLSAFQGVKLTLKRLTGNLSLSANSTRITNFDFHASPVMVPVSEQFQEVKLPFAAMRRAWSKQEALDTSTINSLSIVAYGLQAEDFEFIIKEVSFY